MAKVGYARTSTIEQVAGLEAQVRQLEEAGCERIWSEQLSSVAAARPELEAMLGWVRDGDEIVVTRVDRLARSVGDLVAIVKRIQDKGCAIVIGGIGRINGADPVSVLTLNILGAIAQFEREIMLARQREGIAKAKKDGKYRGRVPTARRQTGEVLALAARGMTKEMIAAELGIGRSSVFRILADCRKES